LYKTDLVELAERKPAVVLHRYVRRYTAWLDRGTRIVRRRHFPSGLIPLIINFDADVRIRRGSSAEWTRHRTFTAGLHDVFTTSESAGPNFGVQIDLTALGARLLYGQPLEALANRIVDYDDMSGVSCERLSSKLFDAPTWAARFDVLDHEIASRVAAARPLNARIERAWETLIRTGGRERIENVRRETGWSERHFAASFRHEFGLTPKAFANVLRFGRAAQLLSGGSLSGLSDVALACGYFDQAHFNRDFQRFAGVTPTVAMSRANLSPRASGDPDDPQAALAAE
jgi:AraC-like DNA-binding protein